MNQLRAGKVFLRLKKSLLSLSIKKIQFETGGGGREGR